MPNIIISTNPFEPFLFPPFEPEYDGLFTLEEFERETSRVDARRNCSKMV